MTSTGPTICISISIRLPALLSLRSARRPWWSEMRWPKLTSRVTPRPPALAEFTSTFRSSAAHSKGGLDVCQGAVCRTGAAQSETDHGGVPRCKAPAQPRARRLQPERMEPDSGLRLFRPAKAGGDRVHSDYLGGSGTRRRNERFHHENCPAAPGQNRRLVETAARTEGPHESREIRMTLPLSKTYAPMEAQPAEDLPKGSEWQYEPKWDGFRCLAFRDGDRVDLESKSGKPLTRYFPELVEALRCFSCQTVCAGRRDRDSRRMAIFLSTTC